MTTSASQSPDQEPAQSDHPHRIECGCGYQLHVYDRDLGRTLRCCECEALVYVAHELVLTTPQAEPARHYDDDDVPADLKPGDRFMATCEVRELIGRGGMAYVHRIHHKGWDVDLALKTPRPDLVRRNDWQRDFERECETWVGLAPHPNVVRCHYIRRLGGIPRLFLEFVSGGSLVHWTRTKLLYRGEHGEVLRRVLDVAMQVAWGLNHAHEQGLVHQDVKPGNILMTQDGQAKVTDFGLMRALGGSNAGPSFYPTSGTPPYSAPEQGPQTPPSHLTDIWGWGASILEMLVGSPRWQNWEALLKTFQEHREGKLDRPRISHIPDPLAELLAECLRTDPEERPGSMQSVIEALLEVYQWTVGVPYEREHPEPVLASVGVLNNRAISLFELGKTAESEILWQQALALAPLDLETRFNSLLFEWRTGRCTDIAVVKSMMALFEQEKRRPEARYLLARIMLEWGDCRVAEDILHRIEVSPQNMREIEVALEAAREAAPEARGLVNEFGENAHDVRAICLLGNARLGFVGRQDGTIECWDPFEGECVAQFQAHCGGVLALACSGDDAVLVSGGGDGTMGLWSLPNCEQIGVLSGHNAPVRGVALDKQGTILVSGSQDHTLRVWRLETGDCMNTLEGHSAGVNAVAVDAAGLYALSGSRDASAKIWNLREAECLRTLAGHTHRIHAVCLSDDARLAVTASRDKRVVLWNVDSGEALRVLRGHLTEAYSACFTGDRAHVFTGSRQGTLKLWNADTGQCLRTFNGGAPAHLERTGAYAFSASREGRLRLWRVSCATRFLSASFAASREE